MTYTTRQFLNDIFTGTVLGICFSAIVVSVIDINHARRPVYNVRLVK
jgi:hypothetical protein